MKTLRRIPIWGWVTGGILLAGAAAAAVFFLVLNRAVEAAPRFPINSSPILVTLAYPPDGAHYPNNSSIPVQARAYGQEATITLELWADGALIESRQAQTDEAGKALAEWNWVPAGLGDHILLIQAKTPQGQASTSNLVRLTTTDPSGGSAQITAGEGDTWNNLAEQYNTTPEELQARNPELDPGQQPDPGQGVWVPLNPPSPPPSAPQSPPVEVPQGPFKPVEALPPERFGPDLTGLVDPEDSPPAAPALAAEVEDCLVNLFITDRAEDEVGFFVYRGGPDQTSLQSIGILEANEGDQPLLFADPGQHGNVVYVVAAFNQAGEAQSNPASVDIDAATCAPPEQSQPGGVRWEGPELILPQPVDSVYYYISMGGGPWSRVPGPPGWFLAPKGDRLDVESFYNIAAGGPGQQSWGGGTVRIEAWGWKDGSLVPLGEAQKEFPASHPTSLYVCPWGCGSDPTTFPREPEFYLDWESSKTELEFEWATAAPYVDKVVWQVSQNPFPSDPVLLDTAFTQEVLLTDVRIRLDGRRGWFTVDFGEGLSAAEEETPPAPTGTSSADSGSATYAGVAVSLSSMNSFIPWNPLFLQQGSWYVRAIPMAGNQVVAEASNVVIIHIGPPLESEFEPFTPPKVYDVRVLEFRPLHWPEAGLCPGASVTETECRFPPFQGIPMFDDDPANDFVLPPGTPFCPAPYDPDDKAWYEHVWDAIEGAVGFVSKLYEDIKQAAVDAVGGLVCGGDATCKMALRAGLEIGLAAMGIPPSIPNLDQLMDEGITYLAGEVANQVTGTDFVDDLLRELPESLQGAAQEEIDAWIRGQVEDLIRQGIDAAKAQNPIPTCLPEEQAHNWGFEPSCGWRPGCVMVRDPRGEHWPATVVVQVTRSSTVGLDLSPEELRKYRLDITFNAYNPEAVGDHYDVYYGLSALGHCAFRVEPIAEPLSGSLFVSAGGQIPPLAPGESITIPFVLEPTDYWIPQHKKAQEGYSCMEGGTVLTNYNDWWKLYYNAIVTIKARVTYPATFYTPPEHECIAGPLANSLEPYVEYSCGD